VVLVIPARYQSVARLMPPDDQSDSGLAMVAALRGGGANMGGAMSDLLGLKTWSQLLEGVLHSRTVEDKIVQKFELRRVYGVRTAEIARKILASQTETLVDRKSQIMTIAITDTSPQRAAAMAQAYVEELNRALADVSTSSARRERIFLEGRLQEVHQDLEAAEEEFSQFASKNTAIDITEQGRAMVGAAATLQGQYIAARSELEGLRQVYSDNYVRVRSVEARITAYSDEVGQ
jgi:capsule polysaccharide export protein KpsE/RkpR